MNTQRERALLCLLLLGCFFTSLNIYGDNGFFRESIEDFNWLPLPLLGNLRAGLLASDYVSHGMLYALGLPVLAAALAQLYSERFIRIGRLVLALALTWKAFLLSADVRFWSTNELIHLVCGVVFLARSGLACLRLVLVVLVTAAGANDLYHQGTSLLGLLQVAAPLVWLLGRDYSNWGAAVLALLLFYYGMLDHSYRTVILLPLVLLCCENPAPPLQRNWKNGLLLGGLSLLGCLTLNHGLFILSPARLPVTTWIQMRKGQQRHVLRIRYPRVNLYDTNDYRTEILRYTKEGGQRHTASLLEPVTDGEIILFQLGLFNQRPEVLREGYLYDFYFNELLHRWNPDYLKIRASWGNEVIFERQHGY